MSADWLVQLAPDHAPPPAGWWPPAPGWWMVALTTIALAALAISIIRWWRQPARRLRRAALRELRHIRASSLEGPAAAQAIENLLRRHAVALHGHERVARLAGQGWLDFIGASGGERLAGSTGRSLLAAAFGGRDAPCTPTDRAEWLEAAAQYIRRAGRPVGRPDPVPASPSTDRMPVRPSTDPVPARQGGRA